ncbi:MAG: aminotransferase class IV [Bacteroidetes bacterium]|nr:aminotransferase class IV [Bacteroidota bacterium]
MKYVNFNGELLKEELQAPARGITQSVLFETILIEQEEVQLAELHWSRLCKGLAHFRITLPENFNCRWLKKQAIATAVANEMSNLCRLRLSVFPQSGAGAPAVLCFETFPLTPAAVLFNEIGLRLGIAEGISKLTDAVANKKTWNPMLYETAIDQCKARGLDDLLVKNTHGNIVETTIANLFVVSENKLYTPQLGDGCVEGVMRGFVMETLAANGIAVHERTLDLNDLLGADELFLTNAIRRIKWVASLNDRQYTNVHARRLYEMLFNMTT